MNSSQQTELSKNMSYLLRHGLLTENVSHSNEYVKINDMLEWLNKKLHFTVNEDDILKVVKNDKKQRYLVRDNMIRANQGHSVEVGIKYEKVNNEEVYPLVHGTYTQNINLIQASGLKKMSRTHIHFASIKDKDDKVSIVSDKHKLWNQMIRHDCDTFCILKKSYINDIYKSENNVYLSPNDISSDCFDIITFSVVVAMYGGILFDKEFKHVLLQNNNFYNSVWKYGELPLYTALKSICDKTQIKPENINFIQNIKPISHKDVGYFIGWIDKQFSSDWIPITDALLIINDSDKQFLNKILN